MCILLLATSQKSTSVHSRRWVRKRDHDVMKHSTCRSRIECVSHCLADHHCNAFSLQSITAVSDIKKSLRQRQSWIITMYTESAEQRNMTSIACDVSSALSMNRFSFLLCWSAWLSCDATIQHACRTQRYWGFNVHVNINTLCNERHWHVT